MKSGEEERKEKAKIMSVGDFCQQIGLLISSILSLHRVNYIFVLLMLLLMLFFLSLIYLHDKSHH